MGEKGSAERAVIEGDLLHFGILRIQKMMKATSEWSGTAG